MIDNNMDYNKYDYVIVGAGLAGSTIAKQLADKGRKVLIIEKRKHIGGNLFDYYDKSGLYIQKYGPHIFHTGDSKVWSFISQFSDFFQFKHRVLGEIDNKLVPIPFNFKSLELTHTKNTANIIKRRLKQVFKNRKIVTINELLTSKDTVLTQFGNYVYEKVFYHYTYKQWGIKADKINPFILTRVPIMLGYTDTYFYDEYQYMPTEGFSTIFNRMLSSKNIDIRLNTNIINLVSFKNKKIYLANKAFNGKFVYTGAIDELFRYKYGVLPYRTLRFKYERYNIDYYQEVGTVNYPNTNKYTRISEYKHYIKNPLKNKTLIAKEYSQKYSLNCGTDPYYPINNKTNDSVYEKYKKLGSKFGIIFCGRLAEYKYFTMENTIKSAFSILENLK